MKVALNAQAEGLFSAGKGTTKNEITTKTKKNMETKKNQKTSKSTTLKKKASAKTSKSTTKKRTKIDFFAKLKVVTPDELPMRILKKYSIKDIDYILDEVYKIFEGDTEYVRVKGCPYRIPFVVNYGYIIVMYNDWDVEVFDVLERWKNGKFKIIPNGQWTDFDKNHDAVAWRGGSGYVYTIHKVTK